MTLIVNKKIMMAHGLCGPGLQEFIQVLGNGDENFTMPFDEALAYVKNLELTDKQFSSAWVENLLKSHKFYLMQGAYTMTDKFQVFNHKTGQHEPFDNLEQAIARRQELFNEFIAENSFMFNVNREIIVNGGPDVMWVPITDLPPAVV